MAAPDHSKELKTPQTNQRQPWCLLQWWIKGTTVAPVWTRYIGLSNAHIYACLKRSSAFGITISTNDSAKEWIANHAKHAWYAVASSGRRREVHRADELLRLETLHQINQFSDLSTTSSLDSCWNIWQKPRRVQPDMLQALRWWVP